MPKGSAPNNVTASKKRRQITRTTPDDNIPEEFKIFVENILKTLQGNSDKETYTFPTTLTNDQRKYIHERCRLVGLNSKSHGKEPNRFIQISVKRKHNGKVLVLDYNITISNFMSDALGFSNSIDKLRVTDSSKTASTRISSLLNSGCALVPKANLNELAHCRQFLPIYERKSQFLELLDTSQVLIISSETGSGKSTQIPQFILEHAHETNQCCKIICTQPRRISTVSVAERVATERGETIGDTVGYKIKLEAKVSRNSALIYCTNGVLLRTFMSKEDQMFKTATHLILDEVHERDKYTDVLLISIRECLLLNPQLKLILMSATCDVELFMSYFDGAKLLHVQGRTHKIQEFFLEDILNFLGSKQMPSKTPTTDNYDKDEMNSVIKRIVESKDEDECVQLLQLILSENANVNHQCPNTGITPLMAAAITGNVEVAEVLLKMGANATLQSHLGLTAALLAEVYYNKEIYNLITAHAPNTDEQLIPLSEDINSFMKIDFNLIVKLIMFIRKNDRQGTILIFFPGYEDIVTCIQKLYSSRIDQNKLKIICLHSSIPSYIRKSVFGTFHGKQKIIFSTNIAETGVTIPDVVYVIDTGLAKETNYDSVSDICIMQKTFISKASADQRQGRAGRTRDGVCFRLYSKRCYDSLVPDRIPEILRIPLYELCLQSKLLTFDDKNISAFLNLAIQSPSQISIDCAITGLIAMGAITEDEKLTELGRHLLQLSIEPRLGKMLIYSVILKCLDPILTLVSCLSQSDLFCLPSNPGERRLATQKQKELTESTLSDHYGLIKAFQVWQTFGKSACDKYFLNMGVMEVIKGTRAQLLSQLKSMGFIDTKNCVNSIEDLNTNSDKWAVIKAAITVGCFPNVACMKNSEVSTRTATNVKFCTASTLNNLTIPKGCVIYSELSRIGSHHIIRIGTAISPLSIALMCGKIDDTSSTEIYMAVTDWLNIEHSYSNLVEYRAVINTIFSRKIADPRYVTNNSENEVLKRLVDILLEEDVSRNFISPRDIQFRPSSTNINYNAARFGLNSKPASPLTTNGLNNCSVLQQSGSCDNWTVLPSPIESPVGDTSVRSASKFLAALKINNRPTSADLLLKGITSATKNTGFTTPDNSVFFVIKPCNQQTFNIVLDYSVWKFSLETGEKLLHFFSRNYFVYLFFTISNTQEFQGFAKLSKLYDNQFTCAIKWLSTQSVSYDSIEAIALTNHCNNDALIFQSEDGQEVDIKSALQLSQMFFISNS